MPTEDGKPIILSFNGGYRIIRNDTLNIALQKRTFSDPNHQLSKSDIPQERWYAVGYYPVSIKGLEWAFEKTLAMKILEKDHENVRILLANIIKAREEIKVAAKAAVNLHPQLVKET